MYTITQEIQMTMRQGVSTPGAGEAPMPGNSPQPQPGGPNGQVNPQANGNIQQILESLPLPIKEQVVKAVRQGATPQQALQPILEKMNAPQTANRQ